MLMLLLLLLEREMREEFSFEEEEDILYTNFQKFSPVHGQSFKKKNESTQKRERESCVCVVWSSVFFLSTLPSIRLNKITRRR